MSHHSPRFSEANASGSDEYQRSPTQARPSEPGWRAIAYRSPKGPTWPPSQARRQSAALSHTELRAADPGVRTRLQEGDSGNTSPWCVPNTGCSEMTQMVRGRNDEQATLKWKPSFRTQAPWDHRQCDGPHEQPSAVPTECRSDLGGEPSPTIAISTAGTADHDSRQTSTKITLKYQSGMGMESSIA